MPLRETIYAVNYAIVESHKTTNTSASQQSEVYNSIYNYLIVIVPFLITLVVIISNLILVVCLVRSTGSKGCTHNTRHATVTVLILSVLFCCLNSIYVGTEVTNNAVIMTWVNPDWTPFHHHIIEFALWMALPLNSMLNPVVYFCRKESMRDYARALWRRVLGGCVGRRRPHRRRTV